MVAPIKNRMRIKTRAKPKKLFTNVFRFKKPTLFRGKQCRCHGLKDYQKAVNRKAKDKKRQKSCSPLSRLNNSPQSSHLLEGFDSERVQSLFQNFRSPFTQREPACSRRAFALKHGAMFVERSELAREFVKVIAKEIWTVFIGHRF